MAETFWVIERFEEGKSLGYWFGNSSREFSTDIDIAIQFHRKQDAAAIRRAWHWRDCEVTEHSYMSDRDHVRTSFVHPPIPIRSFDWSAWIDGNEEAGPYGWGRTEQDAIKELKAELNEREQEKA